MKGKAHSDDLRAQATGLLLAGESPAEVARKLGLDRSTVRNWQRNLADPASPASRAVEDHADEFGELLAGALRAILGALATIAERSTDAEWLAKQGADARANLFGAFSDRAIFLLGAAERAAALATLSDLGTTAEMDAAA